MSDSFQSRQRNIRRCFATTIVLGLLFVGFGLVILPLLPVVQLDAVLTPDQLLDDGVREQTLAMLRKAAGNQWVLWALSGAVVTAVSAVGMRLSCTDPAE